MPGTEDLLSRRLLDSHRYDGTEPWEPVTQLAQRHMEEFTCPGHDFAITMFGGACRISLLLEVESEYMTYATSESTTWEEVLEDPEFQHLRLRWSLLSVRKEDEGQMLGTVLPVARATADRIALAWQEEADRALISYCEGKPELCQDVRRLGRMVATKHVLEHLRHELLGRNSFQRIETAPS